MWLCVAPTQVTITQMTEHIKKLRAFREDHSTDYKMLKKEKLKLKEE